MSDFIHLELHSEFSLIDGLVRLGPLSNALAQKKMPAVALTDLCNLFAMVKFYQESISSGIKPIIGAELWVGTAKQHNKMIALCQNEIGYKQLTQLISTGYLEPHTEQIPYLTEEALQTHSNGLIILLLPESHLGSLLSQGDTTAAKEEMKKWQQFFGNRFYLAVRRLGKPGDEGYIQSLLPLASELQCPLVATNAVRFLEPQDFSAHEARVCIHAGETLENRQNTPYNREQYLKSPEDMQKLFVDLPEALKNTVEIAKRCNLTLRLGHSVLPTFPVPEGFTESSYLMDAASKGLEERLAATPALQDRKQEYFERLHLELDVIVKMAFSGYFLIVADFIQWAKDHKIPVGPGRGSGAGSLVAYALKITDLDPISYELLFERFLNPERISMPDFDVDFCMDNRDRVIEYVSRKYGRNSVSQIVTFGTMAAKAVIRDVGRVLSHPYGFVDKIAKLIPFEIGMTLQKALQEPALKERYEQEEEVKGLIDLALKLEGLTRNVGKHAGGVVIAPSNITDFTPIYCEAGGESLVTQFDKDDVESIGLIKFDFLGLRTLTVIDWAVKNANVQRASRNLPPIQIDKIPLNDLETFKLLKRCSTTAVFQLESRGMKELIGRLQPDAFEEIIALVALFRPGPLQSGMVDDFINRKHGRASVEYPHPEIEHILKPTYGVILYQEQVMQIAQVLAGYTLGSADLLRRAMGKKKPEEMAQQRAIFTDGAVARGVLETQATYIFDLMEKFAGYGFNKSHSAAYALVSYQTAWLKAHYPTAFMAAVLSADMNHTEKVVGFIEEARHMGIAVLPPDVNRCGHFFTVVGEKEIGYGMGAIKGVGEGAIESILEAREKSGGFHNLDSFCQYIDTRKVNRRVLEALIKSGAFDRFGKERAYLWKHLDQALQTAEQLSKNVARGQSDLFVSDMAANEQQSSEGEGIIAPWSDEERLRGEKEILGLYLTGHPYQSYAKECSKFITTSLKQLKHKENTRVIIAGLLSNVRTMMTKRGDRMAFMLLDDQSAQIEISIFSDLFDKVRSKLEKDSLLIVIGSTAIDRINNQLKIRSHEVYTLAEAREQLAKGIRLKITPLSGIQSVDALKNVLQSYLSGSCTVFVDYQNEDLKATLKLGASWQVKPTPPLLQELKKLLGDEQVALEY